MAWETHLLFEKSEPAGIYKAENFCLDEGRDSDEVLKRRDEEMRGRKILKVNGGEEVEVLAVRNDKDGVVFLVKRNDKEYNVHYRWLYYAD